MGIVVWLVFFRGGGEEAVTESSTAPATTITEEAAPAPAPSDLNPEFFAPTDGGLQASPEEGVGTVAPPVAPDTDGDGLTDAEEEQLGTNPQIADTDADGLSDRDEARAYRTDPLNKDTDGDSFPDGSEVQKGYNPKGSGLLFEVPPAG
ncbi:MAG: hypothetical protein Q7R80_05030 [bacterium]|nr:hypothetical protein [bacterium]